MRASLSPIPQQTWQEFARPGPVVSEYRGGGADFLLKDGRWSYSQKWQVARMLLLNKLQYSTPFPCGEVWRLYKTAVMSGWEEGFPYIEWGQPT